jgi:hypothetical protein
MRSLARIVRRNSSWKKVKMSSECPVCGYCEVKQGKSRSAYQNNYYWKVVIPIVAEYMGESKMGTHEAIKCLFLGSERVIETRSGYKSYLAIGSTKELTTKAFMVFLENIKTWAGSELGVVIPDPEPELGE